MDAKARHRTTKHADRAQDRILFAVCTTREWNGVIIAVSQYGPGDEALQLRDFYITGSLSCLHICATPSCGMEPAALRVSRDELVWMTLLDCDPLEFARAAHFEIESDFPKAGEA
jgi:hypothetical protein